MAGKNGCGKVSCVLITFAIVVLLGGCVERKLTINTEPQGGRVVLNDEDIGISPVTVGFNWYGDYKVRISKDGCETLNTHRLLKPPLNDRFPFDFFFEVIWPDTIINEYDWTFKLEPYQSPQREELINAAQKMRKNASAEFEMPAELETKK